jgi:hypothetical protein
MVIWFIVSRFGMFVCKKNLATLVHNHIFVVSYHKPHKQCTLSYNTQGYVFPKKPYTFAGFELRSTSPRADDHCATPHGMSMNAFIDILIVNMHVHMYVHMYVHNVCTYVLHSVVTTYVTSFSLCFIIAINHFHLTASSSYGCTYV